MIALLADIHANIQAFVAVVEDARRQGADEFWLLGDLVDYGANPNEVIELARTLNITHFVGGNHDAALFSNEVKASRTPHGQHAHAYTLATITEDNATWLRSHSLRMMENIPEHGALLTHGSPANPYWGYIYPDENLEQWKDVLTSHSANRLLIGHSHRQFQAALSDGCEIVNPGSVGQPRNQDARAQYALINENNQISFRRIPYNITAATTAIRRAGLAEYLAERLFEGR